MRIGKREFTRTDMWREGKWLDLWSVVHVLSGASVGLGFAVLGFKGLDSFLLATILFMLYEVFEVVAKIAEAPTNRFMDVVLGLVGFSPALYIFAPLLPRESLLSLFVGVLALAVGTSISGWRASQKAAALKARVHERYVLGRAKLRRQKRKLSKKLHK